MHHYLVTGAAGFIGSAVAHKLIQQGHQVTTIDNLSTGSAENLHPKAHFIHGDVQDKALIQSLGKENFHAIFHIAGQSSGEISFEDPKYDLQTNTQSTLLLLDLAKATHCKHFVYASSVSVYGNQPDLALNESDPTEPISFYGVGKLASERYMHIYQNNYDIKTTALRLFNVYGPGQNLNNLKQGMISIYLAQTLKNRHIDIKGSLKRFRDFVHINDVVQAFLAPIARPFPYPRVLNIASGTKTTIQELILKLQALLPFPITHQEISGTPGDTFGSYADVSLAKSSLDWEPKISLDSGLHAMIEWALQATPSIAA